MSGFCRKQARGTKKKALDSEENVEMSFLWDSVENKQK